MCTLLYDALMSGYSKRNLILQENREYIQILAVAGGVLEVFHYPSYRVGNLEYCNITQERGVLPSKLDFLQVSKGADTNFQARYPAQLLIYQRILRGPENGIGLAMRVMGSAPSL